MKNLVSILRQCVALAVVLLPALARADGPLSEDFTGTTTSNNWYFFNGACLTAGTCCQYGFNQSGAIVSANTFPTGQGVQVTFKTVTYRGNSGGAGRDGADGISFFLMDGSVNLTDYPGVGAYGGSLGYSCSNSNPPYDGLYGGYLGLGIDEYGNFLNGFSNTLGELDSTDPGGNRDNTATGGFYKPNRIGLRGAGHISWKALKTNYGTNPNDTTKPYYPASLETTCSSGFLNPNTGACSTCGAGTNFFASTNKCNSCAAGTYNSTTGKCDNAVCPAGSTLKTNGQQPNACYQCSNGQSHLSYSAALNRYSCTNSGVLTFPAKVSADPTTANPGTGGKFYSVLATQATCRDGTLYNYSTPATPTNAGATSLANAANTAKLLDYAAIPNAYSVLDPNVVKIANEAAVTRTDGTPIFYNLKITQDGLLSFAYSINGGAYQNVISKQSISASNGPLPDNFRFGFAGSTGGSTNVHEIMCFKAAAQDQSGSSTGVNEKQSAKIEEGTQAYFAYYNPNSWTGRLTANSIGVANDGTVFVATQANWDAACVLTGVATGETCTTTAAAGPIAAQASTDRSILSWNGSSGVAFKKTALTNAQNAALSAGDVTANTDNRLMYLRGDRTNEVNALGVGLFRARESVLGDIVDSSPTWVGPPQAPYTSKWKDRLFATADMPENTASSTYLKFVASAQTRLNVVYAGANDGLLHGFRTGSFNADNQYINNTTTPNDGKEVLAYMPGVVVNSIHNTADAASDYSSTQYGHKFSVDGTPGTGDLYYEDAWHTWLVGGLGPGGAAIYALDVTDPTTFSEGNASSIVIGEWTAGDDGTSGAITCSNVSNCGRNLGNTYGIPQIRRFHNGQWGAVFGNGLGSSSGDGGIYVMTVDQDDGGITFYYLSTSVGSGNGIAYVAPADLDGDHVTDYVYAGDLKGNVWRFDLTSDDPDEWAVGSHALFTTASGQPITTRVVVASGPDTPNGGGTQRLMIAFGTGQKTAITNISPTTYVSGTQSLYGVWDWDLSGWNAKSSAKYAALTEAGTGLSSPYKLAASNLTKQTITVDSSTKDRDIVTNSAVCFAGATLCSSGNTSFGWYLDLPGTSSQGAEQIVFNPLLLGSAFLVNSTTPADNVPTSCTINTDTGFTYAVSMMTGSALPNFFPRYGDSYFPTGSTSNTGGIIGVQTDATGTSFPVQTANGSTWLVYQTVLNQHKTTQVNPPANAKAKRLTWIELR